MRNLRVFACLLALAPLLSAGPSMKDRLAALRAKHGKAPAQDPRMAVGYDASDAKLIRQLERWFPAERGPWVRLNDLKRGDWILIAGKAARVTSVWDGSAEIRYGADSNNFARTRNLLGNWGKDKKDQRDYMRMLPAGPPGSSSWAVRLVMPESKLIQNALKGEEEREKIKAYNVAYNRGQAAIRAEESRKRALRDAEMAAYRKRLAAQQALHPPSKPSQPTYVPPASTSTYRPSSSGLGPAYQAPSPRPGTQAWHDDRKISNPISYYQNKY